MSVAEAVTVTEKFEGKQMKKSSQKLIRENVGGEAYEYIPLGEHVVSAPGVCGGRPTFKYTRLEVSVILDLMAAGWSIERIIQNYSESRISESAIREALHLARNALLQTFQSHRPAA